MYNGSVKPALKSPESIENFNSLERMSIEPASMNPSGRKGLNINRYATKKTIAQGMMDIALMTANASQLRYILSLGDRHQFYTLMLGLIITSLIMQVLVGILFFVVGAIDINDPQTHLTANIINNIVVVLIFLISIINVVINGFGIEQTNRMPPGDPIPIK